MADGMSNLDVSRYSGPADQMQAIVTSPTVHITLTSDVHDIKRDITLKPGESVILGRASKSALNSSLKASQSNGRFDCPVVSRTHAVLRNDRAARAVTLVDECSLHGTAINDALMKPRTPGRPIFSGDVIRLGAEVARGSETHHPLHLTFTERWSDISDDLLVRAREQNTHMLARSREQNTYSCPSDDESDYDDHSCDNDDYTPSSSPQTTPEQAKAKSHLGSQQQPIDVDNANETIVIDDDAYSPQPAQVIPDSFEEPSISLKAQTDRFSAKRLSPVLFNGCQFSMLTGTGESGHGEDNADGYNSPLAVDAEIEDDLLEDVDAFKDDDADAYMSSSDDSDDPDESREERVDDDDSHSVVVLAASGLSYFPNANNPESIQSQKHTSPELSTHEDTSKTDADYACSTSYVSSCQAGLQSQSGSNLVWNQPPTARSVYDPVRNSHANELDMFAQQSPVGPSPSYTFTHPSPWSTGEPREGCFLYPSMPFVSPSSISHQQAQQQTVSAPVAEHASRPKTKISIDDIVAKSSPTVEVDEASSTGKSSQTGEQHEITLGLIVNADAASNKRKASEMLSNEDEISVQAPPAKKPDVATQSAKSPNSIIKRPAHHRRQRGVIRRVAAGFTHVAAGALLGAAGTVAFLSSPYAEQLIEWLA